MEPTRSEKVAEIQYQIGMKFMELKALIGSLRNLMGNDQELIAALNEAVERNFYSHYYGWSITNLEAMMDNLSEVFFNHYKRMLEAKERRTYEIIERLILDVMKETAKTEGEPNNMAGIMVELREGEDHEDSSGD